MKHFALLSLLGSFLHLNTVAQFKPGYYYKKEGTKVVGLVKFNYGGNLFTEKSDGDCSITFKSNKNGKKVKLTTNDICCFVIDKDSFSIIKNFRLNALVTYPQDFAQVLETGKINLFLYYSTQQAEYGVNTIMDMVVEKAGKVDKLTKKGFKELMPIYLSDYPELLDKIANDELSYRDSEKVIQLYNEHMKNR